mmetsp:Transcript_110450/g.319213  ORF Transcript_110450/g.319213 Transcript_110450/m.319213 type:complete len:259 (-) Transcript_110450:167-943(-)
MTRPRFIKIPARRNRGKKFIAGTPLNHNESCKTAVTSAVRTHLLPAAWLKVVRPGECEPMTQPRKPTATLLTPVTFTSSSTSSAMPVEPSIPAMRNVRDKINTMPNPRKVDGCGNSKGQCTAVGFCTVHTSQKGWSATAGKSHPVARSTSTSAPKAKTDNQKEANATPNGAIAMNCALNLQTLSSKELKAMAIAQRSCQGTSLASSGSPAGMATTAPVVERMANEPAKIANPIEPRKPATTGYGKYDTATVAFLLPTQ